MNNDNDDPVLADIASFAELAGGETDDNRVEVDCRLHVTITVELPGGWGTNTVPLAVAVEVLDRLERDGLRPYRTTIEIVEKPTA